MKASSRDRNFSTSNAQENSFGGSAAPYGEENEPQKLVSSESTALSSPPSNLRMRRDWYSTLATFVAGGVAGAASRTLTAPLDRIKIIVQEGYLVSAQGGHNLVSRKNARLIDVGRIIFADGGWPAFWRGNLINCLKAGPEFAMVFSLRRYFTSLFEDCVQRERQREQQAIARLEAKDRLNNAIAQRERAEREAMTGVTEEDDSPADESGACGVRTSKELAREAAQRERLINQEISIFAPPLNRLGCISHVPRLFVNCVIGAAAGLGAQSIVYPMEVVKTRVCVSRSADFHGGVLRIIRNAYRAGGFMEFYRGFVPNMVGIVVYRGLEMGLYSSAQQSMVLYRMQIKGRSRHDAALNTAEVGLVGIFASTIAQTVSYPLNVVRTRLQTQGSNGRKRAYSGMIDCFLKMIRNKGVRSLFSGLTANYVKAIPAKWRSLSHV